MKTTFVKHSHNYCGFRKDKVYHSGTLKTTLSLALGKWRLLLTY